MPSKVRKNTGAGRRARTPWQFGQGKYLSTPNVSPRSVSTGASVDTLRNALGLRSGPFDEPTRDAVMSAQDRLGLEVTGVVTEVDWHAIVNPTRGPRKRRSAPPAGGMDGADEPDAPTGQLDPPQGP
jgi:Putative peptidoglycan binding domain